MTTFANDAELRDAIAPRDAQAVGHFETRFTDPSAWLETLRLDIALLAIQDNIVWLAIVSGPAKLEQVESKWSAGGSREVRTFGSRYVEASFLARGQMQKLSAYCGVVWTENDTPTPFARELSEATAKKLQETMRNVQVGLSRYRELEVRSGGALHLHSALEPWMAHPDQAIEVPTEMTCADCAGVIYWANNAWRHKSSGRAEAFKDAGKRHLDHLADPELKGRMV